MRARLKTLRIRHAAVTDCRKLNYGVRVAIKWHIIHIVKIGQLVQSSKRDGQTDRKHDKLIRLLFFFLKEGA
jgi:hypothetical protein